MAERDLLDRLEKATGPDERLDLDIYELLRPHYVSGTFDSLPPERQMELAEWARRRRAYTASLDAAIALVERTEGACYRIEKVPPSGVEAYGGPFWATAGRPGEQADATGPTAPVTLLRALFRARLSRGEQRE
jgi:hypothetical protein